MLIGVFEVGWALRGYLVLVNASREAARFAVRPGYVNYDLEQPQYSRIIDHAFISLSDQIPFTSTGSIIISHYLVKADWPCNPDLVFTYTNPIKCDCQYAIQHPYTPTIAISPGDVITYSYKWPVTTTEVTRLDVDTYKHKLITDNLQFNCDLMNHSPRAKPPVDSVIVVEMFFHQKQLFGFPLISNPFTDPVPMYAHTTMRVIEQRE